MKKETVCLVLFLIWLYVCVYFTYVYMGFPGSSVVKNLPANSGSILALEIPWSEEPGGLRSMEWQKSQTQLSN